MMQLQDHDRLLRAHDAQQAGAAKRGRTERHEIVRRPTAIRSPCSRICDSWLEAQGPDVKPP